MNKFLLALVAVMMLFVAGCASTGSTSSAPAASSGDNLPEIAAYDDEPFDPLPDNVPAE